MLKKIAIALGLLVGSAGLAYATGETVSSWFVQSNPNPVLVQGSDGTDAQPLKVTTGGILHIGGPAADDAAASGNPVPMGCMFETTADAVDANDIARVNCSSTGAVGVAVFDTNGFSSLRQVVNATDSTGAGIAAVGLIAQVDDTSPTNPTENQFANVRMTDERALLTSASATTTGTGTTLFTLTAANSDNATNVKASAGNVYAITIGNESATVPAWLSLYNTAGTPTCGTGIIQQFFVPSTATGATVHFNFSVPKQFATGIGICFTTGIAGTGSVAATDYVINIDYK